MSFPGGLFFTSRGRALQAKAQTGVELNFTRIGVGDGQLEGQAIDELTALISEKKSLTLNKYKTLPSGKAVVGGILSNQGLVTGFYWRELGLFATDPDLGEILYCYGNAGALAEYIPAEGGAEILEKQVNVVSLIGNASNVSATIDQSLLFASQEDLLDHASLTATAHGAVSAATASTIMLRDANARSKVAAPAAADDIALKSTVTADIATHQAITTTAHGAVSAATANRIMLRDAAGRAKVIAPAAADDIARKDTVDAVQTNLTTHLADYIRQPGYGTTAGSANTYTLTLSPAPTYVDGLAVSVKINVTNTGASTININSLGAKTIKAPDGADVVAGDLLLNSIYSLRYNGTNFILQGKGGVTLTGNAGVGDTRLNKTFYNTDAKTKLTGTLNLSNVTAGNIKKDVVIDGVTGTLEPMLTEGGTLLVDNSTERAMFETSFVKLKEFRINGSGKIRTSFGLKVNGTEGYGRIYKNGVAIGIERSTTSNVYTIYTEDFIVINNDLIQLYVKHNNSSGGQTFVAGFKIYVAVLQVPVITLS